MSRVAAVLLSVIVLAVLTLTRFYALALGLGVGLGAVFLLRGVAAGGGMGNARGIGGKPADVSTRIGVCLAAMGIAAGALGHEPPFPLSFRVFYVVCLIVGGGGALWLARKP